MRNRRLIPTGNRSMAADYYRALDEVLVAEGIIALRSNTGGKPYFLRDEPKLWNKLGLLVPQARGTYFHSGYGLAFNWRKIISVLEGAT